MNILTEIVELADEIILELATTNFFKENPFVDSEKLQRKLEIQMQYNWEQLDDMHLSEKQMIDIIKEVHTEGVHRTINKMYMSELLIIDSVDKNGELVYKINPEKNLDDYLQS